ncbi:hypothetical protein SRABI80_00272 [Peribacillus frigoritolerans]|uniref:hypothetical protein n=1 Tax=Peribacillus frigoritolerans TaxID=450367 RepID=UPI001D4B2741|nr:hypothetical protein [Peribacillus frigoritolerans]MCU6600869.1 hypothetical protein [Peribacillus frigoritolerans]ULM97653.1 hypothetical protein L8956_02595 [Peribacillus frigoritolerans]UYY99466.1 hypothetical protein OJ967_02625 [Peribacillus frigoritolerans]CAH0135816.1 hypothetical protein SRABI80_00272 [Peribacillus frigoritolerans]
MKKLELEKLLIKDNVPKNLYSLNGGLPNEVLCLNKRDNILEVYYSERGLKSNLKKFDTEDDACEYFYKTVLELLN